MRLLFRSWPKIIIAAIFFILFLTKCVIMLDPDFGWRLQTGQLILQSGIPSHDPFSYSMPSFAYIDHSWLVDAVIARLFSIHGVWIPSIILAVIVVGTLFLSSTIEPTKKGKPFLLVLSGLIFFEFIALRPLVISWFFLSMLVYSSWLEPRWNRYRYFLPLLFFIWANCHGGFVSGLLVFFIKVITQTLEHRRLPFTNLAIFLVSIGVTLLNPYGLGLWGEVQNTVADSSLRFTITEWLPGILSFNPTVGTLAVLSCALLGRYWRRFSMFQIFLFILSLLAAMATIRNVPLWTIVAIPTTLKGLTLFQAEVENIKGGPERLNTVFRIFLIIISVFVSFSLYQVVHQITTVREETYYPKAAVAYLTNHQPEGNIFAPYNWGGYLIWKYPQKKVFIDGRMPSWREKRTLPAETANAFLDYRNIVAGQTNYQEIFEAFNITTVIWTVENKDTAFLDQYTSRWEKTLTNYGFIKKPPYKGTLLERLEANDWQRVYKDDVSVIYVRRSF